jgi:hypothetical protein
MSPKSLLFDMLGKVRVAMIVPRHLNLVLSRHVLSTALCFPQIHFLLELLIVENVNVLHRKFVMDKNILETIYKKRSATFSFVI